MSAREFTDNAGRQWAVAVDTNALRRVKARLGVTVKQLLIDEGLLDVMYDPVLLIDVLAAVLEPELQKRKLQRDDLGSALSGDVLEAAQTALLAGLVEYLPTSRRRIVEGMIAELRAREAELADQMRAATTCGDSSTSSPQSQGSTPDP